jgi:hypothetical protein
MAPSRPSDAMTISQIKRILTSPLFRCPGSKITERAYLGINTPDQLTGSYDERGRCTNMVSVVLEKEIGDYGSIIGTDVHIEAPCVDIHLLNDDSIEFMELMAHYSERRYLLKQLNESL